MTNKNNKRVKMTKLTLSCGDTGKLDHSLGASKTQDAFP